MKLKLRENGEYVTAIGHTVKLVFGDSTGWWGLVRMYTRDPMLVRYDMNGICFGDPSNGNNIQREA